MIDDPVIGERVCVFYDRIGGVHLKRGIITGVVVLGTSVEVYMNHAQRGSVLCDFVYRYVASFAGPIPVTWRSHDATPRGLGPVLSSR